MVTQAVPDFFAVIQPFDDTETTLLSDEAHSTAIVLNTDGVNTGLNCIPMVLVGVGAGVVNATVKVSGLNSIACKTTCAPLLTQPDAKIKLKMINR
jgi:hypothetical protein